MKGLGGRYKCYCLVSLNKVNDSLGKSDCFMLEADKRLISVLTKTGTDTSQGE